MSGRDEASPPHDDPISPSSFVEHIRELGEKRDREDQERNRLLEEQILQERQRSLSPEKSSPPVSVKSTPRSSLHLDPSSPTMDAHNDALQRLTGPTSESPVDETSTPSTPTRSNTMSWQQRRPTSTSSRRPLSLIAAENSASRSPVLAPEPSTPADDTASRSQIAQSLGSKDPAWFRQTPDRGIGSPANRRSREDDDTASISDKRQLPGMSRDTAAERPASPHAESVRSSSPSRASSVRDSAVSSNRLSRDTSVSGYSASEIKSPLPMLESQRFRPPPSEPDDTEHGPSERNTAMSPSMGRMLPERTPSPTKGMGGFVQSAMMRRSDSVNKRWSVQTSGSLSRQNSTAGTGAFGGVSTPKLDTKPRSRGHSIERPSSSHSNTTEKGEGAEESFTRPNKAFRHSRGKSVGSITQLGENRSGPNSPASPSKRWSRSPTKSSWLESALSTKPESPKPKPQPEQPSWMAEINRIKAQKASVDLSRPEKTDTDAPATPTSPTKFPSRDALRRPESRGSAQGAVAQSPDLGQGPPEKITDREQLPAPESAGHIASTPKGQPDTLSSPKMETAKDSAASPTLGSPADKAEKPAVGAKSPGLRGANPPASKPEESKPDFRSALKHRQRQSESVKKEELEFQNVFGKLRKTHTEKFVAPDTFKENINRGKDALNITGGPAPRVKKDEFRDSLVKQRQSIQMKAEESGGLHVRTGSLAKPAEPIAEALEKRKLLGRNGSVSKFPTSPTKEEPPPAEPKQSTEAPEASEKPVSPAKEEPPAKPSSPVKEEPPAKPSSPIKEESPAKPTSPVKEEAPAKPASPTKDEPPVKPASPIKDEPSTKPASPAKEAPPANEALAKLRSMRERKATISSKPDTAPKDADAPAKPVGKLPGKLALADRFNNLPDASKPAPIPGRPSLKPVGKLADRFPGAGGAPKSPQSPQSDASSPSKPTAKVPGKLADRFNATDSSKPASSATDEPAGKLSSRASGKLADRFNPNLAAMLARGGPSPGARDSGSAAAASPAVEPDAGSTKELTHMTKGRARGPKRRAPKTATTPPAEPAAEIASPQPVRKASVVANVALVKDQDVLPSSPTKTEKPEESKPASPPLESKPKPVAPAKSAEVSRRVSAKLDSPTEPPVPAKSPELSRRISAKFEQPATPPSPGVKSPDLARRISAKFEQRKSPPPEPSTPKPSEMSKKASGKFDSQQSTMELNLSEETKTEETKTGSPKKVETPTEEAAPAKPASPTKVESPVKRASLPKKEPEIKPASPTKIELPVKPASPPKKEPEIKPASPTKVELPVKRASLPKEPEIKAASPTKVELPVKRASLPKEPEIKPASPTKVELPVKRASLPKEPEIKAASPTKVESPVKPEIPSKKEPEIKAPSPKAESPIKPSSPSKEETTAKPESPTKPDAPAKSDTSAKSDIAKRIAALKQGGDQAGPSQPGSPKPLFSGASRLSKDIKSPTSPSGSNPSTPTVESPKPQKPLPQTPAAEEEAKPPTPAKDQPETKSASVKNAAAMWGRQPESASPGTPKVKSPIKLPTRKDEQEAMENAGLVKPEEPKPIGLGIAALTNNKESYVPTPSVRISKELPAPPTKTPMSPPTSAGAPPPKPVKKDSISSIRKPSQESPIPQQSEAGQLFAEFFDDAPVTSGKLDVDAHSALTKSPLSGDRVKTLKKEIQEISGDGKLTPIPPQEEHILFDNSMYLCNHAFASSNGAKHTEVYLWTGSAVPEPAVEDAQLFARKAARDVGGKLLIIRQGKECPNFFQAVGGILVTRKGSRTDHSKQYMLCGRQHLGHMAFDEVELSINNLCSGFPYLVSSRTGLLSGKIFLWKGKGCTAEELGCARLIGMDLGLTPEIEEVEEGLEPAAFLEVFPEPENGKEKKVPRSADHWRLKAKHEKYGVRLFRIDEKPVQTGGSFQVSSLWPVSFVRRVSAASTTSTQGPSSPTESSPPQNNSGPAASGVPKPNMTADVVEIAPFSQMDLEAENIYVLDAFFEIYIIVGALSRGQSHAFSTALMFAQEYGILAASLQDRPFIPVSTVVLEGVPRDMKAVFRRWEDQMQPTAALMAGKPRRGKSLRIVGLQAAIAATRENGAASSSAII
ncbi:Muscle M-line assembly protein unc-89 [Lasiodiplodia hormozganensis]|uniref:Muscle M-line assembly protein unc-89 n=1 Tax=Lasiodiplodia hormozganensis TaxID=869390 RepID=A0AA39XTU4_9PEZI|nr:Muscle M-line assembly protein unc-89 [Lasiodiplodia hormozganensis]